MIEWIHTATKLGAYNLENRWRGMIIKKIDDRDSIRYKVFINGGYFAGSVRTMGQAREICRKELEDDDTEGTD